jgi:predicted dehydrogenase
MTLRIAAIGHGDIAQRRHFPDLKRLGAEAELVAIAGRNQAKLAETAKSFAIPSTYTDPAEMLARETIDAVLILTPPDTHAEHARLAISAGKHVMIEKPLVRTREEANALRDAAAANPGVTIFALPHYATAEFRLVQSLLEAKTIGEVTHVESHRGHRGPTHAAWFYNRALAGGGVLLDLGIYQLTAIAALLGPATAMTANLTTRFETRTLDDGSTITPDVEDSAILTLTLATGAAVAASATWNGYLSHHATRARTTLIGRAGILHFGVADGCIYVARADGAALPGAEPADFDGDTCQRLRPAAPAGPPNLVAEFLARIQANDTSRTSLTIQSHVLDIILTAYASTTTPLEP